MDTKSMRINQNAGSRSTALAAGWGSVAMVVAALFAEMVVRQSVMVKGDATATAANLSEESGLFLGGLIGYGVILALDIVLSWAYWRFFKQVNSAVAGLSAALRLVYTAIFGFAIGKLWLAWGMEPGTDSAAVYGAFMDFERIWAVALVVFGGHLLALGYLAWRSGQVPRWLAVVVCIAGSAYIADNLAKLSMPNYEAIQGAMTAIVALSSIVGEVGLAIWMIARGGRNRG